MSWIDRILNRGEKAVTQSDFRHSGQQQSFLQTLDFVDLDTMARDVGDGSRSDVLTTPLRWLQRAMAQAPLIVVDDEGLPVPGNALQELLDHPNDFYTMRTLLSATTWDLGTDGNAFWIPVTNLNGRAIELWYAPRHTMEPVWPRDGSVFISHYRYRPVSGVEMDLLPGEVIHFRDGMDPKNPRLGCSALKGLLREIWTDNEAASFTAALLRNGGVPGLMLSPRSADGTITEQEAKGAEAKIETKLTREGRGRLIVMTGDTRLEQFGFSPAQLDLAPIRNISEERVTAALGVPAAVVGFGSGLEQTKVGATMEALVKLAWWNGVIPLQDIIDAELSRFLAPMFNAHGVAFDRSEVEALSDNQDALVTRAARLVAAGIWTRAEAKESIGSATTPGDEVYLMSIGVQEVPAGAKARPAKLAPVVPIRGTKHHHGSPIEERVIATAPKRPAPPHASRFADLVAGIRESAPARFQSALTRVFEELGEYVSEEAMRQLAARGETAAPDEVMRKAEEALSGRRIEVKAIRPELDLDPIIAKLEAEIAAIYGDLSGEMGLALGDLFGLEFILSEESQQAILREGGLRVGLLDLDQQTRDALFDSLETARAEGLAGDALARRIRDDISAGPWRDVATRARVIARTESAHAANFATLESARSVPGVEMVMVHDDRAGHGDEVCSAIDGRVVTIDEAEAMGLAHPNCTRSFTPLPPALLEELGL